MHALHDRYYGGGDARTFRADLAAKTDLIVLTERGVLRGFSTLAQQAFRTPAHGEGLAIFSGDTIIDHEHWGEQSLARSFCRYAGALKGRHPTRPLYWFLISKGYRTYRYLQAFARTYYPRAEVDTPPDMQHLMDVLARDRFGSAYHPELGIVRFEPVRGYLRAPWSGVREGLRQRPEVRFFLERNSGYVAGDELVCLTELDADNLRAAARREFVHAYDHARHPATA